MHEIEVLNQVILVSSSLLRTFSCLLYDLESWLLRSLVFLSSSHPFCEAESTVTATTSGSSPLFVLSHKVPWIKRGSTAGVFETNCHRASSIPMAVTPFERSQTGGLRTTQSWSPRPTLAPLLERPRAAWRHALPGSGAVCAVEARRQGPRGNPAVAAEFLLFSPGEPWRWWKPPLSCRRWSSGASAWRRAKDWRFRRWAPLRSLRSTRTGGPWTARRGGSVCGCRQQAGSRLTEEAARRRLTRTRIRTRTRTGGRENGDEGLEGEGSESRFLSLCFFLRGREAWAWAGVGVVPGCCVPLVRRRGAEWGRESELFPLSRASCPFHERAEILRRGGRTWLDTWKARGWGTRAVPR